MRHIRDLLLPVDAGLMDEEGTGYSNERRLQRKHTDTDPISRRAGKYLIGHELHDQAEDCREG